MFHKTCPFNVLRFIRNGWEDSHVSFTFIPNFRKPSKRKKVLASPFDDGVATDGGNEPSGLASCVHPIRSLSESPVHHTPFTFNVPLLVYPFFSSLSILWVYALEYSISYGQRNGSKVGQCELINFGRLAANASIY